MADIVKPSPVYILRGGEWWFPRCPSSYQGGVTSMVSDARNADGLFRGDEIRGEVAKCSLSFNVILANELAELLQCFSPRFDGKFVNTVRFLDMVSNDYIQREMYVGDRDGQLFSMAVLHRGQRMYVDFPLTFFEV